MAFVPRRAVVGQVAFHLVPRFLWNHQHANAELGHDATAFGGDGGGVGAVTEGAERVGPDLAAGLLDVLAVELAEPGLQAGQQALRGLDEPGAGLVHVHAKTVIFHLGEAAPDAQDETSVAEVVQHGHLLGDAHGVVPRQDADHAAEFHVGRAPGHVGEKLEHVGAHGVVGEVVFDAPDGLETQGFCEICQAQFLAVHLVVAGELGGILEDGGGAYVHDHLVAVVLAILLACRIQRYRAARTLSGAQACMTAWVEAISGRAEMTRTRATSRPSASLAKASAAPSGLP